MVLYQPKEIQKYIYYVEDHPEVFWIHFTGYDVKNILTYHGIPLDQHVFYSGTLPEHKMLFRKIIRELQQCKYGYEDYIASMFNTILLLVSRQQQEGENVEINIPEEIEAAVAYFNENYNTKISVEDYAESLHISTNWFIRNFKQYMKISPAQYILSLRMVNAQSLSENTDYKKSVRLRRSWVTTTSFTSVGYSGKNMGSVRCSIGKRWSKMTMSSQNKSVGLGLSFFRQSSRVIVLT